MPNHLSAYPNPFKETLSFEIEVEQNVSTIVKMVNPEGKIVKLLSWNIKKGINKTAAKNTRKIREEVALRFGFCMAKNRRFFENRTGGVY